MIDYEKCVASVEFQWHKNLQNISHQDCNEVPFINTFEMNTYLHIYNQWYNSSMKANSRVFWLTLTYLPKPIILWINIYTCPHEDYMYRYNILLHYWLETNLPRSACPYNVFIRYHFIFRHMWLFNGQQSNSHVKTF
jgi:hypothetical protein